MKSILIYIVVGILIGSCQRDIKESSFGTPTSQIAIELAQIESIAKLDPYQAKSGQMVHILETQEVISSQAPIKQKSKEWTVELKKVENFESDRVLTTRKKVTDFIYDENFIYEFKSVYLIPEVETLSLLDQLDTDRYKMESMVSQLRQASGVEENQITGVSFHNLNKSEVTLSPPQKVKDAKDCKNITGCQISADKITYDIVFLLSDGSTQIHNIEWIISSEVPFFAAILRQCATTVVPLDNLRVLVKQCNEVVDFNE